MSVLDTAIGWLAPTECVGCGKEGSPLCPGCSALLAPFGERCWRCNSLSDGSSTCPACRHTGSPGRVFICTDYRGVPRELVRIFKFGHQRSAASALADMMARTIQSAGAPDPGYLIVPVPTATARRRERGFGHTELLARELSLRLGLRREEALGRLGQSQQLGSKREERLSQLADKFYVKSPKSLPGAKILLVDDVVTTGGTLIAATQALRKAGASRVDALVFAKKL
ncbi:MAG TPA: ComF family protein [Candidatus Saccharimonadales bacterium]|nr:ComF family protein [Candidatus Saccharimonadales bacterium]